MDLPVQVMGVGNGGSTDPLGHFLGSARPRYCPMAGTSPAIRRRCADTGESRRALLQENFTDGSFLFRLFHTWSITRQLNTPRYPLSASAGFSTRCQEMIASNNVTGMARANKVMGLEMPINQTMNCWTG